MKVFHINDRVRNVKNDITVIIISTQILVFKKKKKGGGGVGKGANCMNYGIFSQVIRGLLKFWPKTCSQKEVRLICC